MAIGTPGHHQPVWQVVNPTVRALVVRARLCHGEAAEGGVGSEAGRPAGRTGAAAGRLRWLGRESERLRRWLTIDARRPNAWLGGTVVPSAIAASDRHERSDGPAARTRTSTSAGSSRCVALRLEWQSVSPAGRGKMPLRWLISAQSIGSNVFMACLSPPRTPCSRPVATQRSCRPRTADPVPKAGSRTTEALATGLTRSHTG